MSSYTVIARKWRPQNFEDVVGQNVITQTLQNAIRSNRVGHAFLFSGARGVGKTTTARILARALNCHQGPTVRPCGDCVSCSEIAAGNSLDVLEIDAASNTGVDNIRELRETIQYRTARDRFKIFIIDEVHMLSSAAFNALLKTLEEPPEHVKFIMATTEPHRIPATILSRCQHFEFQMISYQQILDRLRLIVQTEKIEISDYALRLICSASEGSMRDAQSTLEQIRAYSGTKVPDEEVRLLLGVIAEESLNITVAALIKKDRKCVLDQLSRIARHGHNLQLFCRKLLEHFRHLLVIRAAGFDSDLIPVSSEQEELLKQQAENFSEMDLLRIYDLLFRAESELRWHPYPLFHLEITLLKILQLPHLEEIEKLLSKSEARYSGGSGKERTPRLIEHAGGKAPSVLKQSEDCSEMAPVEDLDAVGDFRRGQIEKFLEGVRRERPALSAFLEKAQLQLDEGGLVIRFTEKQKVNKEFVEQSDNLGFLQTAYAKIVEGPGHIQIEMEIPAAKPASVRKTHRALEDPRVQLFTETFPGKISIEDLADGKTGE